MRLLLPVALLIATLGLLTACSGPAPNYTAGGLHEWVTDDPHMKSKLGPPVHVASGYSLRLPKSYKMLTSAQHDGGSQYIWCRDANSGGPDTATIALIIGKQLSRKADSSDDETLISLYKTFGKHISAGVTDFVMGEPEIGTLNRIKFIRGSWTGTSGGQNQQGRLYATIDQNAGLCLLSTVPAADSEAMSMTETAILTFSNEQLEPTASSPSPKKY